jgi:ATP-binding cassette, subfamily B, bacterial
MDSDSSGEKPQSAPPQPHTFVTLLSLVRDVFRNYRRETILTLVFYTIKSSPIWLMPIMMARMIDLVDGPPERRVPMLLLYLGILAVAILQNVPMHTLTVRHMSRITRGIGRDLRVQLCRQLQNLSVLFHVQTSVGKIQSKAIRDIESIERVPEILLGTIYQFTVHLIVAVVAISLRAPWAVVLFLVVVPLAIGLQLTFRKVVGRMHRQYRLSMEGMTSTLNDMLEMIPITRAHGLEKRQIEIVQNKIEAVFDQGCSVDRSVAVYNAASWVSFHLLQFTLIGASVYAGFRGWLTVGDIVMFNSFLLMLFGQMMGLLMMMPALTQAKEAFVSIQEVLNAPDCEENDGKGIVHEIRGGFEMRDVAFQYPRTNRPALQELSLSVRPGECVAFVGPSGSGKSTMLSLLLGFVRPEAGLIELDGVDMQDLDLRTYRRNVSVVTQEPVFFSGTILDNVTYGNPKVAPAEVIEALRRANALGFVQDLPEGWNTRMGAEGVKLSGGQQQRLAIARAIIRDPKVLILDEATSALDAQSERSVQAALDEVMRGRTTFIVAHRISTVRNADRIVILEKGRVAGIGSPEELLASDNFYSRAVWAQQGLSDLAVGT